jgi:ankyrin repeat protein
MFQPENEAGLAAEDIGWTPLHMAATGGDEADVKHLLELGADVDSRNREGWAALHGAAGRGHETVCGCY